MDCPREFLRSNKIPSLGDLDSVCTALGVSKPFVRFRIIGVSEARQMKFNEAAGAFRSMEGKTIKEEKILEIVQEWLMVGKQTVELLEPSKRKTFEEWQHEILTRATQFLQLVVNPRLFMLQRRMGLQMEASEDDILRVKYLYTAVQQDTLDSRAQRSLQLAQSNRKSLAISLMDDEVYSAAQLRRENSHLKAKIAMLEKENEQLRANNTSRFSSIQSPSTSIPARKPVTWFIETAPATPTASDLPFNRASPTRSRPNPMNLLIPGATCSRPAIPGSSMQRSPSKRTKHVSLPLPQKPIPLEDSLGTHLLVPEPLLSKVLKQPSSHGFLRPSEGTINRRRSRSTNTLEVFQTRYEGISPVRNNEGSSSRTADFPAYRGLPFPFPFRRDEIS